MKFRVRLAANIAIATGGAVVLAGAQQESVVSREVSARAASLISTQTDVHSREVSIRSGTTDSSQTSVASREVSVRSGSFAVAQQDVVSRELSAFAPAPDLVTTIVSAPSSAVAGVDTITVSWMVVNIGGSIARAPWSDGVSLVPVAGGSVLALGTVAISQDLGLGAIYVRTEDFGIPSQAAGEYQLRICSDSQGLVFELEAEANNCAQQSILVTPTPRPDLAVTLVSPPPTANDGEGVMVTFEVTNVGTADATATWSDRVYLSADPAYDGPPTDYEFGPFLRPMALPQGQKYTQSVPITIPAGLVGDHWFIVRSDAIANEQSTVNNTRVASAPTLIYQPNKPNLVATRLETVPASATLFVDNTITILWEGKNIDDDGTANGTWVDRLFLSPNSVLDGTDPQVGSDGGYSGTRGPGQSYLQTRTITLPPTPGTYTLFVVVDVGDAIQETDENDNTRSLTLQVVEPSYTATILTTFVHGLTPSTVNGLPIPFTGQALDRTTLLPVPDTDVSIRFVRGSTRRVFITTTNGTGDFSFTQYPLVGESGQFTVYADHPAVVGDVSPATPPQYTLFGIRVDKPAVYRNIRPGETLHEQIVVRNLGDTAVGDVDPIQLELSSVPSYLSVTNLALAPSIPSLGSAVLSFDILADPGAPIEIESLEIRVNLPVDGTPLQAASILFNTQVTALTSNLVATPSSVSGVMQIPNPSAPEGIPEGQSLVSIALRNTGEAIANDVTVMVDCVANPPCTPAGQPCIVALTTPQQLGDLLPGSARAIDLTVLPNECVAVGTVIGGAIRVFEGAVLKRTIPFQFTAVSDRTGTLSVRVEDELTYYSLDGTALDPSMGPLVVGATVELTKPNGVDLEFSGATTSSSQPLRFDDIPEGFYRMVVSAPQHGSYTTIVRVGPGAETTASAFVPTRAVSYQWSVVPTEIQDEYEVTITAQFETFVPVPRLVVTPTRFDGTPFPGGSLVDLGDVVDGEVILLNVYNDGLIAALGVELVTSAVPGFEIVPLLDPVDDPDHEICSGAGLCYNDLGARQSLVVPVQIFRASERGGSVDCNAQVTWGVQHYIWCGEKRYYWTPIYYQYPRDDCGSGSVVGGFPPTGGEGGSGGGGSPYFFLPSYDVTVICGMPPEGTDTPPPGCVPGGLVCCPQDDPNAPFVPQQPPPPALAFGTGHETDSVIYPTGEFFKPVDDLRILGRGPDFLLQRTYISKRASTSAPQSAFGYGWDFNWNASLSRSGPNVVLREGNGRADLYEPEPTGGWCREEFFRRVDRNPDATYAVLFPDRSKWNFHPVDGSAKSGKIASIEDRNGNRLRANYDASGRLTSVTDTLDREISFAYDSQGLIESVTDFTGRQVRYAYYLAGDADGSAGDLKSVTSPVVTGTPTGNDFPNGTTTVYTYSKNTGHIALDHNLLTIRDANGRVYVENTYHATTDPTNRDFDRVIRQRWGDAGDVVDIYHVPVVPTFQNRNAIRIIVVNDRVGNVREYDYDVRNRLVAKREYTGRANPDLPSTLVANRPFGALHGSGAPLFHQTNYDWTVDSLLVRRTDPNGTAAEYTWESELDPAAEPRLRGNLREIRRRLGTYPNVGNQTELVELFTYVADAGGCCGSDWVETYTDPRGNLTSHIYDLGGNRLQTTYAIAGIVENWEYNTYGQSTAHIWPRNAPGAGYRQRDEYNYFGFGPQRGYLQSMVEDATTPGHPNATGFEITTSYEFDALGRVIREVDPNGHDTLYVHNAKDQLVRELSPLVQLGAITRRIAKDYHYDANGNVVRIDLENVDENGQTQANTHISTILEYETLNHVTATYEEELPTQLAISERDGATLDLSRFVVNRFEYDANRNQKRVLKGEANAGTQPESVLERRYDERDLLYQLVRAPGSALESVVQTDYDGNRWPIRTIGGQSSGDEHVTTRVFDAFGRIVQVHDPMGNVTTNGHDKNGNLVHVLQEGELSDVLGSAGNQRLAVSTSLFDELDRMTRLDRAFFDYSTPGGQPVGDGFSTMTYAYTDRSAPATVMDDNNHATETLYDTAGRRSVQFDARGNAVTYAFDDDGNILEILELDRSDVGLDESFKTTYVYDALDRLIESNQHDYDTTTVVTRMQYHYDSRGNRVRQIDALGNVIRWTYDELDRELDTIREMTDTGVGGGTQLDPIMTSKVWDKSSRLLRQIDDNMNPTAYVYDPLDRKTGNVYADNTSDSTVFDVHDNAVGMTDANGTVVACTYDANDRLTEKNILVAIAEGVSGDTTFELYRYDGLGRLVEATDDDSIVLRTYDSLSNNLLELQSGQPVAKTFDGVGNALTCTYPSGRVITTAHDSLNRKDAIYDQDGFIADFAYVGAGRTAEINLANGTTRVYGYDGLRRTVRTALDGASGLLADRTYTWDPMSNKTGWQDLVQARSAVFEYDSAFRLVHSERSDGAVLTDEVDYELDGVGNRLSVTENGVIGHYSCDATLLEPADCQMNLYTTTPWDQRIYDKKGSMLTRADLSTAATLQSVSYDYAQRPTSVNTLGLQMQYAYDAVGRRVMQTKALSGDVIAFQFAGWEVIEETGSTSTTYVLGETLDKTIVKEGLVDDEYYYSDDLGSILYITSETGSILAAVEYDDYGAIQVSGSNGPYYFAGLAWSAASEWYWARTRWLEPRAGRYLTQDIIGAWGDKASFGNAYAYVANNPGTKTDPFGLWGACAAGAAVNGVGSLIGKNYGFLPSGGCNAPGGLACGYVHCVNNCITALWCGDAVAYATSYLVELAQERKCKSLSEDSRAEDCSFAAGTCWSAMQESDFVDNAIGRSCKWKLNCRRACEQALGGKTTEQLPEGANTPRPSGYLCPLGR